MTKQIKYIEGLQVDKERTERGTDVTFQDRGGLHRVWYKRSNIVMTACQSRLLYSTVFHLHNQFFLTAFESNDMNVRRAK